MDIKEALARISKLEEDLKLCGELAYMCSRDGERGEFRNNEITISAAKYEGRYFSVTLSDFRDLLELRRDQCRAEIARLQPVVDMANLALRGLLPLTEDAQEASHDEQF